MIMILVTVTLIILTTTMLLLVIISTGIIVLILILIPLRTRILLLTTFNWGNVRPESRLNVNTGLIHRNCRPLAQNDIDKQQGDVTH